MSWLPGAGHVLVVSRSSLLLAAAPPAELRGLVEVVREVARARAEEGEPVPFHLVLQDDTLGLAALRARLDAAGARYAELAGWDAEEPSAGTAVSARLGAVRRPGRTRWTWPPVPRCPLWTACGGCAGPGRSSAAGPAGRSGCTCRCSAGRSTWSRWRGRCRRPSRRPARAAWSCRCRPIPRSPTPGRRPSPRPPPRSGRTLPWPSRRRLHPSRRRRWWRRRLSRRRSSRRRSRRRCRRRLSRRRLSRRRSSRSPAPWRRSPRSRRLCRRARRATGRATFPERRSS